MWAKTAFDHCPVMARVRMVTARRARALGAPKNSHSNISQSLFQAKETSFSGTRSQWLKTRLGVYEIDSRHHLRTRSAAKASSEKSKNRKAEKLHSTHLSRSRRSDFLLCFSCTQATFFIAQPSGTYCCHTNINRRGTTFDGTAVVWMQITMTLMNVSDTRGTRTIFHQNQVALGASPDFV